MVLLQGESKFVSGREYSPLRGGWINPCTHAYRPKGIYNMQHSQAKLETYYVALMTIACEEDTLETCIE